LAGEAGLALPRVRAGGVQLALELADALELGLHLGVHLGLDALPLLVRLRQLPLQGGGPRAPLREPIGHLLAEVLELELEILARRLRGEQTLLQALDLPGVPRLRLVVLLGEAG